MTHRGLSAREVEASRAEHGENVLTPPPRTPLWKLFFGKFSDPVIRILLIAAFLSLGISFVHGEYYETVGIFCAIFLATGVSFWFEVDAARKFDLLNQVNDDTPVRVIRDGQVREVGKREIVVGDIILLETGDEVPADAELLEAMALQVDESNLTGEPSAFKTIHPEEFRPDATYPGNLVLRGTSVIEGHGVARVVRVGDATEFGRVATQATVQAEENTPLNRQLERLAKLIGVVGFGLAVFTFAALFLKDVFDGHDRFTWGQLGLLGAVFAGLAVASVKMWLPLVYDAFDLAGRPRQMPAGIARRGWFFWLLCGMLVCAGIASLGLFFGVDPLSAQAWIGLDAAGRILNYFMVAVTLIVVAVPEGLPMAVTLALALSIRKMLKSNNLVRKMHACETMGATTVICTDKTGTLTANRMSVEAAHFDFGVPESVVYEGIAVNTTAELNRDDPSRPKALGNPTEGALLLWLDAAGESYAGWRERAEVIARLPFSTRNKYMATLVRSGAEGIDGQTVLYVKGAPEIVLGHCAGLSEAQRTEVEAQLAEYQQQAMRTLGFAYRILPAGDESAKYAHADAEALKALVAEGGLTFAGYTAIMDPVREDVPAAVAECMEAGIAVKIVTGDTPGTAREIGRRIGLWDPASDGPRNEITGVEWEALSDEEALERAAEIKIMSRARPMDKQRLVQLLQRRGEVVAVTGDGTNDAPALNFANVGLSMGSGTSVAREASDITLLDDSFASIATAVMWGRSVYRNIQRFVLFQLTINVAALTIVFLGSLLGFALPLTVTQMLWVNLIMDTFAAGALASLPPDRREMSHRPRRTTDFIITPVMRRSILWTGFGFVAVLLGLLAWFGHTGGGVTAYELSLFFTVFVLLQFWNMFNAKAYASGRSAFHGLWHDTGFLLVAALIVIGQVVIVSFGGEVFRVVPLSLRDWAIAIGATSAVLWIGEALRLIRSRRRA
ncbi:calcium-translocating P-type ATPase, PMCA-type [uncultured Rikenella sp.]|uniref:calcium-translocating P-type ATPase, PMCA-type n=1 Tax=uncultured Rikenella sp. TaxID=368003 RepID=UPI002605C48F|nr:calcium-translocating P-type ATPase, PMCA-type [uncultured Rikenella sp.]